jgi:hypothetical protein
MSTVLPGNTKEDRELKREIAIIDGREQDSYLELTKRVSDLFLLSQKEVACLKPKQRPKWAKAAIVKFIHVEPNQKTSKDFRVHHLSKMLDIGTVNTLEVCRVSFLFLTKKIEFYSRCSTRITFWIEIFALPKSRSAKE